jgi:hypothetical protein
MPTRRAARTPLLQRLVLVLCVLSCLAYGACPARDGDGERASGKLVEELRTGMGPER